MEKFSLLKNKDNFSLTSREQIVNSICSTTGLSENIVTQIYESQKLVGMVDSEIVKHFNNITKPKSIITADEFIETLISVLNDVKLDDPKKSELTNGFIALLSDNTSIENESYIDSVNLISIARDILIAKNPEAEKVLGPILTTTDLSKNDINSLNESFNMILPNDNTENTIQLYEGLKTILSKNNRRWGNAYHLDNSYNAIMSYIDTEITKFELDKSIVSIDNNYHKIILRDFMTGNVNPMYKNFSAVKELISDTQTLVFDMLLLINQYISSKEYDLKFVSRNIYNDYRSTSKELIAMLASSRIKSKIINQEFLREFENKNKKEFEDEGLEYTLGYYEKNSEIPLIDALTNNINGLYIESDLYNISLKSVIEMINFIKSASFEFNLKIRPVMRTYVTKSLELSKRVESARILKSRTTGIY